MCNTLWISAGLILLSLVVRESSGQQFIFEVRLHSYSNNDHRDSNGECCRVNCIQDCRSRFVICAQQAESSACSLGLHQFRQNSDILTFADSEDVPNLLMYSPDIGAWPGGFQIVISVENRDGDSQIEQFRIIPTITRNHTFTEPQTINGEFGSAMIVLSFRLTCTDNFYGDNCEVFCLGRDDDSGHYFCNPITGAIECLPGFRDPSRGCTVHMGTPTTNLKTTPTTEELTTVEQTTGAITINGMVFLSNEALGNEDVQANDISGGAIAGIVIGLLIGCVLVVLLTVGILCWRQQKRAHLSDPAAKQAVDNPNYAMINMNNQSAISSLSVSPAPVYVSTQLSPAVERTLDNDNPLYFSTTVEGGDADYAIPPDAHPSPNNLEEHDYDFTADEQGYPPPPSQPPPPTHKRHAALNPYGEYSDRTLKKVASQHSVNGDVFDNPDYA